MKIEAIIQKRFEKINEALDKVRMHANEDDIRLFRVKVKKLNAFLHFINVAKAHGNPIKLPQKIDRIYHICGAIRTLQMQQEQVQKTLTEKHLSSPETYSEHIAKQILQQKEKFNKHIKGPHPFKKEEEKLLKLLPGHVSPKAIEQMIQSQGDNIEKLLIQVFPSDKSFHEARKLFKGLLYISPYLEMEMSAIPPFALSLSYEEIDAFTISLGGFHDLCTSINCLHTSVQAIKIDENEKATLRTIESLWLKEKETYRIKIYDELQKITAYKRTIESPVEWLVM